MNYQEDVHDAFPAEELVGENVSLIEVPSLFEEGRRLRVSVGRCPLLIRIQDAIEQEITSDVRGDFIPLEMYVNIGEHDLIASDEIPEGALVARAFVSVSFWGYGFPTDVFSMRQEVFRSEEVQAVKKVVEGVTGPLREAAFWSL